MTGPDLSNAIDADAAAWLARRDAGPLSPDAEAEFAAWIAADLRHLGAYARAEAVFAAFDRARALQTPDGIAVLPAPRSRRAVLGWGAAVAASLAGVLVIPRDAAPTATRYASQVGELRRIALADGSRLTLGTAAEVLVRFDAGARRIELVRGTALFDVAKDPARPFVVGVGRVDVTAVGTSFSVEHGGGAGGSVLVRHGIVAIGGGDGAAPSLARAGDRVAWSSDDPDTFAVARVDPDALRRGFAWTEGMLAFKGETMAEASAQFARYGDFRITIADPALAQKKVTGWFSAGDPRGFAHAAAASLGAVAEDRENAVIIRPGS